MPGAYEKWLVPTVFGPFAVDLAARIAARAPARVLEVAAGTGVLTRELARVVPEAAVTATDLNDAMVALGRTRAPGATWQQADAMRLPFGDAGFDVVACQFGVMFLPDKPAGYAEVRRVLTPDGAFVFNAWSTLATHEFEAAFMATLERIFPTDPPTFLARTPHGYADPDRIVADLQAGGLRCTDLQTMTLQGRTDSVAGLGTGLIFAAIPGLIMRSVPESETGSALGVNQVVRQIGFSRVFETTYLAGAFIMSPKTSPAGIGSKAWACVT